MKLQQTRSPTSSLASDLKRSEVDGPGEANEGFGGDARYRGALTRSLGKQAVRGELLQPGFGIPVSTTSDHVSPRSFDSL